MLEAGNPGAAGTPWVRSQALGAHVRAHAHTHTHTLDSNPSQVARLAETTRCPLLRERQLVWKCRVWQLLKPLLPAAGGSRLPQGRRDTCPEVSRRDHVKGPFWLRSCCGQADCVRFLGGMLMALHGGLRVRVCLLNAPLVLLSVQAPRSVGPGET